MMMMMMITIKIIKLPFLYPIKIFLRELFLFTLQKSAVKGGGAPFFKKIAGN